MMMHHAMNQLCKVCGEPAAGFHFGAFTCEGCKSFFGRTYNNLSSLSECKNNGRCVINKKNRTSCKSCRLRKCLIVGMSKSGSRYGRRSNWFKIHCLLQDQAAMNGFPPMTGGPKLGYEADECGGMTPGGRDSPPNYSNSKMADSEMGSGDRPDSRGDSASPPTPMSYHQHLNHIRSTGMLLGPGTVLGRGGPGGGGLPSPFSPTYDSPSPPSSASSASDQGTKREFLHPPPQLPISPISPLSPMNQPKFLFGPTGYLNGTYPKFLGPYRPYLPFLGSGGPGGVAGPFDHLFASSKGSPSPRMVTLLAPPDLQDETPPEQEDPIDLSVKKSPPDARGTAPSRSPSPSSVDDEDSMRDRNGYGSEGHSEPGSPIRPNSPLDLSTSTPLPAVSSPCPLA